MAELVRTVDLFSGCGGLSLGFDLYNGQIRYQTVMALDNDIPAVRCYNTNFPQLQGILPTSRLCDLTWFKHKSEALLYYLTHLALHLPDTELIDALMAQDAGLGVFLSLLRYTDQEYKKNCSRLMISSDYQDAFKQIAPQTFTMQIVKIMLGKLGFTSLRSFSLTSIPWEEEYNLPFTQGIEERPGSSQLDMTLDDIRASESDLWETEVAKLEEASIKEGKGRNKVVGERLKTLLQFFHSEVGTNLKQIWLEWKSRRDSIRALYCIGIETLLQRLYTDERRIHLVLGGPPCKGFSRIGRAVVESLRDQGVHAWSSEEYGDERNALLHKYVLFLDALKPDAFVFENVANFQSALKTPAGQLDAPATLDQAITELSTTGLHYSIKSEIIRAKEHAIPQDRERFILVGFNQDTTGGGACKNFFKLSKYRDEVPLQIALNGLETPKEFSFSANNNLADRPDQLSKAYTFFDVNMPESHKRYIQWIRQPGFEQKIAPIYTDAHIVRKPRPDDFALIEKFAPGQRWMDYKLRKARTFLDLRSVLLLFLDYTRLHPEENLPSSELLSDMLERVNEGLLLRLMLEELGPAEMGEEHHLLSHDYLQKGYDRHGDWLERLSANKPCKTIVAHIGKDTYGYIHPYENRAISMREAARIQSFPDFFKFGQTGIVDGYTMIGNAVPPLLAHTLAEQLAQLDETIGIFSQSARKDTTQTTEEREITQLSWTVSCS